MPSLDLLTHLLTGPPTLDLKSYALSTLGFDMLPVLELGLPLLGEGFGGHVSIQEIDLNSTLELAW